MEISLVLTDDSGSYQAILGQFIQTAVADTLADRQLAQAAATAAAQSESDASDSASAAAASASAASDSATSAAADAVQTAADRIATGADATATTASAADASASAGTASAQAADAAASASAAGTSETNAAASAADAAATLANALVKANNLSDVADAATSLSNLGAAAKSANLSDLASAATARNNLGLGTSATVNTGTSGAAIPLLNAANTWALLQTFTVRPAFNGNTPYDTGNTVAIANGGTGAVTASLALAALGAAALAGSATQNFSVKDATSANHAIAYDQAFGLGQTWQDVHASRVLGTTYTNSTSKAIDVNVAVTAVANDTLTAVVNGAPIYGTSQTAAGIQASVFFTVPPGATYVVALFTPRAVAPTVWSEFR